MGKKKPTSIRSSASFSIEEKHQIIAEYLAGNESKTEIWAKHTGGGVDHGALLQWMRQLGYSNFQSQNERRNTQRLTMSKKPESTSESRFEIATLKKRIEQLEKQLREAEVKAVAFSTMVDIAEAEFKVPIRKKFNSKPSKL